MAVWCANTAQTHTAWRELTRTERKAFEDVADEIRQQLDKRR